MTERMRSERRPYKMTRLSVLLLLVHAASGFKFMSNWKMPTVGDPRGRHKVWRQEAPNGALTNLWGGSKIIGLGNVCGLLRLSLGWSSQY